MEKSTLKDKSAVMLARKIGQILEAEPYLTKASLSNRIGPELDGFKVLTVFGSNTDHTIAILDNGTQMLIWCSGNNRVVNLGKVAPEPREVLRCHKAMFQYLDTRATSWDKTMRSFASGVWDDTFAPDLVELIAKSRTLDGVRRTLICEILEQNHQDALMEE